MARNNRKQPCFQTIPCSYYYVLPEYFTLILKMTILINCTSKFYYRHRIFQITEAAPGGVLKNFRKFTEKYLCQSLFFKSQLYLKKRLRHRCFSVNFAKFLRTSFCKRLFLKIWKLRYMITTGHSCLIKSFFENIWKISRSTSALDCQFC